MKILKEADDLTRAVSRIESLQSAIMLLRLRLALKAFDPDQPRWPRGQSSGGEGRPTGGAAQKGAIGFDRRRASIFEKQQELDWALCRMSKSRLCWETAMVRYAACMTNDYIPDLRH